MRDLMSYFSSNVLNESTNSRNTSKDVNSSFSESADKKRQYDSISDDSASVRPKQKSAKVRKNSKCNATNSVIEDDSSDNEFKDTSDKRRILRRRSSTKNKLDNSATSVSDLDSSVFEEQKPDSDSHIFGGMMNSSSTSISSNGKRACRKRSRRDESDPSEPEQSDSSGSLFNERPKRTYSKKPISRETKEGNNLFNYFAKAEKSAIVNNGKLDGSPIDCLKRVQVVVQVHSPPQTRTEKINKNKKNTQYPVIKLARTDVTKALDFDLIEVVKTEDVSSQKTKSVCGLKYSPKKKTNGHAKDEGDDDLSMKDTTCTKTSLNRLLFEDSEIVTKSEGKTEIKKNIVSKLKKAPEKIRLNEGDILEDSGNEDTTWKMRVQLAPKSKIQSKPKKTKSRSTKGITSSSDEETILADIEVKKKTERESTGKQTLLKQSTGEKSNGKNPKNVEMDQAKLKSKEGQGSLKQTKLAPLFRKQCINVDDEARKSFLSSGLPEVVKKKFEEQKSVATEEETYAYYKFPIITHVQQKTENLVWNLREVNLHLKDIEEDIRVPKCDSLASFISNKEAPVTKYQEKLDFDFKDEVSLLKKMEPAVNVGDVYTSIKRLNVEAESMYNICWTDKYKPANCTDLIGNTNSLMKLKEWIESHKRLKVVYDDDGSSSEEFIDSDDSNYNSSMKDNVAILAGPPGCGKTCAVYLLAKELGFEVLEVNSATNRNGKRLLDELLEATQSHRVKRISIFDEAAKSKKSSRKKKKKKSRDEKRDRKTMSLILIEDADILFENYDEGFLSALSTLARESKRPLVFTVNNINYPHLNKYKNNLILHFEYPSRSLINVWLKLIALTEGVKLSDAVLVDIFQIAGLDVRKSLLQLQMLISSKLCHSMLDGERIFYQNWYRPITRCAKQQPLPQSEPSNQDENLFSPTKEIAPVGDHNERNEELHASKIVHSDRDINRQLLEDHVKFLDVVTLLGRFQSNEDENDICTSDSHEGRSSADICTLLKRKMFSNFEDSKSVSFSEYYSLVRKNAKIKSVYANTLSNFKFPLNDRYAKYCDFLPTLRNITRLEQPKQSNQLKRTSRFFSYLKSINIYINDQEIEFLRESMI